MSESLPSTHDPLTEATQLVKNGRLDQAKEVLTRFLMKNPASEQGWLLMSFVLADPAQQKDCLERVLRINPNNTVAQSRLAHLLGKRTEELFQGKGLPPAPPPSKSEIPAPRITPPPPPVVKEQPAPVEKIVKPATPLIEFPPSMPLDSAALQVKKSPFRGKWFLFAVVLLIVLILGIVGTVLYIGVIGPAISHLSITSTPTPQAVVVPTLPPVWTNTLTPTVTPTPDFTATPTVTPTPPPTSTRTSTKPATKKP